MTLVNLSKEELCLISIALNAYQMELDNYHLDEMKQVSRIMMMKINMPFIEYDSYKNGKVIFNYYGGVTSTDWLTVRAGLTYGAYAYPDYNNYKEPNGQIKVNHSRTGTDYAEIFYMNGPQSLYGPIEFTV